MLTVSDNSKSHPKLIKAKKKKIRVLGLIIEVFRTVSSGIVGSRGSNEVITA